MQQIDEFEDKKTHGKKIQLTEFIVVDGKQRKKKKGKFYKDFVKNWSIAVASLPQDDVEEAEIVEDVAMKKKKKGAWMTMKKLITRGNILSCCQG